LSWRWNWNRRKASRKKRRHEKPATATATATSLARNSLMAMEEDEEIKIWFGACRAERTQLIGQNVLHVHLHSNP